MPENFKIRPVPKNICSFVTSILQILPVKQQRLLPKKSSELALSNVGVLSCLASESETYTSNNFPSSSKTFSCHPLLKLCEKQLSLKEIKMNWWKEQSVPPYHMWHRNSWQTTGQTPDWKLTVNMLYNPRTVQRISQSRWHQVKAEGSTYDGTDKNAGAHSI